MQRRPKSSIKYCPLVLGISSASFGAVVLPNSSYTSTNWAGYFASASPGQAFTNISATWTVPTIQATSSSTTYSANWIGFDGVGNQTVEQCGTLSYVTSGQSATYFAWYEFYPNNSVEVSMTVDPQDVINAQITYEGNNQYLFKMTDTSRPHDSFSQTLTSPGTDSRASAEWIDEAPGVNGSQSTIADFGAATFSNDLVAINNGGNVAAGSLSENSIDLNQGSGVVAAPTAFTSGGEAFTINYLGTPATLVWNNSNPANIPSDGKTWDTATNYNWQNGGVSTTFTIGSDVLFSDSNNGDYAVTLNSTVTPGAVTFNNSSNNYTLSGTGSIADAPAGPTTLTKLGSSSLIVATNNSYSGGTTITGGTLQIGNGGSVGSLGSGPVTDNAALVFDRGDAGLVLANSISGSGAVWQNGSGTTTLSGSNSYTGNTTLSSGTLIIASAGALPAGSTVINNAALQINGNSTSGNLSGTGSLTINNATLQIALNTGISTESALTITSGTLDLTDNELILNYGAGSDPITTIQAYLASGYNSGNWNGPGIISSTAQSPTDGLTYSLGYADGADNVVSGLASGQIEIKYTLVGDLNLDGIVDGLDFAILARNFNTFTSNWDAGDLLYHGVVNGLDFAAFAKNFGHTAAGGSLTLGAADWAAFDSFGNVQGLTSDVPEPTSASLLLALAPLLARRRKKLLINNA